MNDEKRITIQEAVELAIAWGYDVPPITLTHAASRGDMRAQKVGSVRRGYWFTTECALRDYLEKRYHPRLSGRRLQTKE